MSNAKPENSCWLTLISMLTESGSARAEVVSMSPPGKKNKRVERPKGEGIRFPRRLRQIDDRARAANLPAKLAQGARRLEEAPLMKNPSQN